MTHISIDMTINKGNLPNDTCFNRHGNTQIKPTKMTNILIDMTINKVNLPNDTCFNRHDTKQSKPTK